MDDHESFLSLSDDQLDYICKAHLGMSLDRLRKLILTRSVQRQASRRVIDRAQQETSRLAVRGGRRWTPEEDTVVLDTSITLQARAKLLGRTYHAVNTRLCTLRKMEN